MCSYYVANTRQTTNSYNHNHRIMDIVNTYYINIYTSTSTTNTLGLDQYGPSDTNQQE